MNRRLHRNHSLIHGQDDEGEKTIKNCRKLDVLQPDHPEKDTVLETRY